MTTKKAQRKKPRKPRKDFPLYAHASGQWAKKVRGQVRYFGPWADPTAAEKLWEHQKFDLLEGREPKLEAEVRIELSDDNDGTLGWLCNAFLDSKSLQLENQEITQRTFNDYKDTCNLLLGFFDRRKHVDTLKHADFDRYRNSLKSTWAPTTKNNHLRYLRALFSWANETDATGTGLFIRYKAGLKSFSAAAVRKHMNAQAKKLFTAEEIWRLFNAATIPMKAFILLGINCAYGTSDIAVLRKSQVNGCWLGEPRGKTGIARGAFLWPETRQAIESAVKARPTSSREDWNQLCFLTRHRRPWAEDGSTTHALTREFLKLKTKTGISKRFVGHYSLRHTFATVAGNALDQQAVDYVMGHLDQTTQGVYREEIAPERVEHICNYVRSWWQDAKPSTSVIPNA